jgi:hypothetical protein
VFSSDLGASIITTSGKDVAWNGSRWVAVGEGGNTIVYSSDGITWTGAGASIISTSGNGVAWNGSRWVAVGEGGNTISYSSDGITWTGVGSSIFSTGGYAVECNRARPYSINITTVSSNGYGNYMNTYTIDYNSSPNPLIVAVGQGTTNTIATSNDGINWVGRGASFFGTGTNTGYDATWNGTRWVVVGGATTLSNPIIYSSDGITWMNVVNSSNIFICFIINNFVQPLHLRNLHPFFLHTL